MLSPSDYVKDISKFPTYVCVAHVRNHKFPTYVCVAYNRPSDYVKDISKKFNICNR